MRLLLDTHIALWQVFEIDLLPKRYAAMLLDAEVELFVSAATIWEIAIKHALIRNGQPMIAASSAVAAQEFVAAGMTLLPVTASHAAAIDTLPRHHGDPFDRMLIAQALSEPLRLVTADKALAAYGEIVIVV